MSTCTHKTSIISLKTNILLMDQINYSSHISYTRRCRSNYLKVALLLRSSVALINLCSSSPWPKQANKIKSNERHLHFLADSMSGHKAILLTWTVFFDCSKLLRHICLSCELVVHLIFIPFKNFYRSIHGYLAFKLLNWRSAIRFLKRSLILILMWSFDQSWIMYVLR